MTGPNTFMLTGIALFGLAIAAFPPPALAQSDLETGLWQLNLAKSKFSPGPPQKSRTLSIQREGQNIKATLVGITATGNPQVFVELHGSPLSFARRNLGWKMNLSAGGADQLSLHKPISVKGCRYAAPRLQSPANLEMKAQGVRPFA